MLAGLVETGLSSWWAPALAFAAGVVSFASPCVCRWSRATSRSSPGAARPRARAGARSCRSCCSSSGSRSCSRCSARSPGRSSGSSADPWFQRVAGLVVLAARPPDARLRVPAAGRRGCTRSGGRSSSGCAPARPGRSRSGWRSPPAGRRASGRCSRGSSRSRRPAARSRVRRCWPCTRSGLGVPFLLVGLGRRPARGEPRMGAAALPGDRGGLGGVAGGRRRPADDGTVPAVLRPARAVRARVVARVRMDGGGGAP